MAALQTQYLREDGVERLFQLIFFNLFVKIIDVNGVVGWNARLDVHFHDRKTGIKTSLFRYQFN